MKTSTNGHRAGVLMTAAFALFTVLSVTAQFGTQESIVPNRIPPADIPGISGDGGNSSQRAPSGSISVAENATYNAMTPQQLVQNVLVTGCLQAENIRFGYYNRNNGNWTNHTWSSTPGNRMLGYFERATSGFALEEGLVLSTGRISSAMGPNNNAGRSDQMVSNASDPDLATISGRTMYDAAVLEFDFIPAGNTVEFKYVFASEEYLEYVHTNFNDAFGFFLSGPGISGPYSNNAINLATLPNGEDVTINTIHPAGVNTNGQSYPAHNAEYYIDNPSGSLTMQFDGYTVELTATYPVTPCATYRIKMAIADASDQQYDAAVFLGARSFNAETLSLTHFGNGIQNNNNIFEGCTNNRLVVTRMTTDLTEDYHVDLILAGSAINGSDILTSGGQPFPTQIVIPAGQASYEIPYYAVNDGTGDNAETFIVRVRNSCPCDENISYVEEVINIYEQVTIASVSATNAQCAGQSNGVITINATGGSGSYQYSINNGTTWQSSNTFTGLSAGSYTVLVRDPGSCYEPVSAAATIGEPQPIVANAGSDVSICSGTSTQLNGTGGVLYSWSPATGLSNPSIANPVASPAVTTTYTLTVTNASGQCASTDQVIVTVNPSPVITVNPAEVEVCRGTEVTITASGAASYVWNPGGATSASITVSPVSNTSYTVTGTAANGCTGTASSLVIVKATPNNVSAGPDAGIGLCETHQLQGSATGSGTLLYTWAPATGLSNANIANPVFTPSTSGTFTFTLTVTNQASGCSVSDEMSIEVAEPLSVTSVVNNNSCTTVADGSINITVTGGSAPYTYSWTGPNGYTAGTEDLSNIVAGTYSVLVTDADGCTFNGNYTVGTVPDTTPPTASNPADIVLSGCNGTFPDPDILVVTDEDDNCETPVVAWVSDGSPVLDGCIETIVRTYSVTDGSGNSINVYQNLVRTVDTEAPVISTAAVSGDLGCNPDVVAPAFTGLDNCAGEFAPEVSTEGASNEGCAYTQTWTANYTDACGNVAEEVSITYTWTVDTEAPVISTAAVSGDLGCNPEVVAPAFTGLDNCAGEFAPEVSTLGESNTGCVYSQTWTANYTDACGNAAAPVSITYTWTVDTELPVISTTAVSGDLGYNPTVEAPEFTGLDNCTGVFAPVVSTDGPVADGCNYSQTWTANYTDACGNIAVPVSITYTWTVDNGQPVISTAAQSGDLGCNPVVTAPVFTGMDACSGAFEPNVSTAGPVANGCIFTQTWTATYTNEAGNIAEPVSITYTWTVDTEAPVISTAAVSGDLGCNPEVVAPAFTGLDNCAGEFAPEVSTEGLSNEGCAYTQTWTANYTDACGNVAEEVSITYTWTVDTEAPVISTAAVSGDLGCNPTVVAPVFTGLDNCAGEFTPEVSTEGPSNEGCAYTQTWTANYTDACGNVAEQVSITYTWTVDTEAPVISTVAISGDLGCNPEVVAPAFTGLDNCAGEFAPEVSTLGASNTGCVYSQTWTANYTDACGNVAEEVSITYTWTVDTDAPVFTNAPADLTVNCNGSGNTGDLNNWLNSAVAEDICGEVTITHDFEGLSDLCGATGSATVTWTATDNCGNQATTTATFTIVDTQAPELTCPQNIVAVTEPGMCGAWIVVPVPAAIDACGEVTLVNNITGTNNATGSYPLGVTTIIWTATDECGNVSTCSMTITINDNEDPHIICPQHITINNDPGVCEAFVNVPQPVVSDNCEIRTLVNTYTQTDDASAVYPVGTTVVWWTVVDMSGNSSSCFMNITVVDAEAPVIVCPEDIAVSTDPGVCEAYVTVPLPEVSDNCGVENVTNSFNGADDASGTYPVGTTTVIWTVTDVNGHIAECSMTVTVSDNELPAIDCPEDIAVSTDPGVCEAYVTVPQPVVSDNCGIESVVNSFNGTGDASGIYPTGTTTINWTVFDIHGNQSECVMSVTVTDNELPVIVCPEDINVNTDPGVCEANVTVPQPVVSDNCGIELVVNSFNGTDNASGIYPTGTTTVVWTVTDIHGLTSTCEMTITVTDNELPVIECPEDITVVAGAGCTALVEIPEPVVSDNCGIESVVSSTGAAGSIELPAGIHEVSWIATDIHGNQASCSILVTVIAGPIANDDNDVTEMNIPVSVPVLENDTDCDNNIDPSTVTVITNPANGFTMVDPQNGNILYTPNTGFHGTDTFIYRVCDLSGLCDDATVTIVIEGEDPPAPIYLIAVADLDTTLVNTPRLITNMFNDIVPEGITAGIEILTQPSNGYLELHSDMTVTYTPATDFTGMDEFTYILYDINGVAISDTAVSVIVVVPDPGRAEIIIYNGITPNGDGRNDKWIIDGIEEYGDNEILLFNRWGDQVRYFENYNNTSVVWDGTNKNGKMLPDGTYYYIVKLRSVNEIYTGWVIIHGSK